VGGWGGGGGGGEEGTQPLHPLDLPPDQTLGGRVRVRNDQRDRVLGMEI